MNATIRSRLSMFVFLVSTMFATYANASPVNCAAPAGRDEARACTAAAQGVDELRRFIARTRGIYILYIQDFSSNVRA